MPPHPRPGLVLLRGRPDALAVQTEDEALNYAELSERTTAVAAELGATRRLILLAARNTVATVSTYLAALAGGHPVLLAPGGDDPAAVQTRADLEGRFSPDVVAADGILDIRRSGSAHRFADELALLAPTSGSTGSPKLVRLSRENLLSNASAIADYLGLSSSDRGITALPMHYCYGLSVVNSHLLNGGGLILTERSITDEAFWTLAEHGGITGFPGVPHSFDLLDAVGGPQRLPSTVRYVTQAGGRLPPERVRALAHAGAEHGFEFFTMYGQTEATARMSFLPPEDAVRAAGSIGRPIPGGSFRIDAPDARGVGELVYSGPNVMLGYATTPEDLALGRTVHELRTGDLARHRDDGYVEIVGRMSRFVKIFGIRIDLDGVQRHLESEGIAARTASSGEELLIFALGERDAVRARASVAARTGIPLHCVHAHAIAAFPLTASGKPDHAALVRHHHAALTVSTMQAAPGPEDAHALEARVLEVLAVCTGRPDATRAHSFAALGGDSLSYIEAATRLEELLGPLPRDWPSRTAAELVAESRIMAARRASAAQVETPRAIAARPIPRRPRRTRAIETPTLLRAVAIVLVVGTHAWLLRFPGFSLQGGAHLLLIVAGYNLARFALSPAPGGRPRRLLAAAGHVAVPAVLWIGAVAVCTGLYAPLTVLLVNNAIPPGAQWEDRWQFWFLEAIVWGTLALAALFAIPAVDRLERRGPWAFAVAALAATVTLRFAMIGFGSALEMDRFTMPTVLWFVALGWTISRADSVSRRLIASVAVVALTAGFFGQPLREAIVIAGGLALVWITAVPLPAVLARATTVLASSSLFVYLTHWVVYLPFKTTAPLVGTVLSFAVGIGVWLAYRRVSSIALRLGRILGPRGRRRPTAGAASGRPAVEPRPIATATEHATAR